MVEHSNDMAAMQRGGGIEARNAPTRDGGPQCQVTPCAPRASLSCCDTMAQEGSPESTAAFIGAAPDSIRILSPSQASNCSPRRLDGLLEGGQIGGQSAA